MAGERRMEAENYLASGYGLRIAMEARKSGWARVEKLAKVSQPPRLKGIQVSKEFGTPFLAATQVFDLRPTPRKFLSLEQIKGAAELFVRNGQIVVTRSGSVGKVTLAHKPHEEVIISDDLLRVEPRQEKVWGWLYSFLRAPQARAMMGAAQYGHVIKHLEVSHLNALPIPKLRDKLLEEFSVKVGALLDARNRAVALHSEAERLFSDAIGSVHAAEEAEVGFAVKASDMFAGRRRLEGSYWLPMARAILSRFKKRGLRIDALSEVSERVWWMTRFKRVFGDEGNVPYMSADELFSINPAITKRVVVEQADNAGDYFVKAGWIVMACSGQVYGLNGSVALMTKRHETAFFSHDLVRIVPKLDEIRPGYLFTALGHPELGRPLVIRYAYGTSIPHLEPSDVATFPLVRLESALESRIADRMEEAVNLRAEADALENEITAEAEALIDRFIGGDTEAFVMCA